MSAIYTLGILGYGLMIRIAALWNAKAGKWVSGRKGLISRIETECADHKPRIWMHCPSLGEFEQGRPLLESLRQSYPKHELVLTFYSPSGYEIQKDYSGADKIYYLPLDTPGNARRFVRALKPELSIFVKYDYWLNFLLELKKHGSKVILASGIFRRDQHFFSNFNRVGLRMLNQFDHLFVQDDRSRELIQQLGFDNVSKSGDTRFDRVKALADQKEPVSIVDKFSRDQFTIVAGSTWPADENLLLPLIGNEKYSIKWVIAPHELSENHLRKLEDHISIPSVRYSRVTDQLLYECKVLIIDNIGLLSRIYQYADIAYVGGGFGKSIHNILEAATWGAPVVFGPRHDKFAEAHALIEKGGAVAVNSQESLTTAIDHWHSNRDELRSASLVAMSYVRENAGSTAIITGWIRKELKT